MSASEDLIRFRLFEERKEGDYVDFVEFQEDDVRPLMQPAQQFVAQVETLLTRPETPRP